MQKTKHTSDNYHPVAVVASVQSGFLKDASKAELKRVISVEDIGTKELPEVLT